MVPVTKCAFHTGNTISHFCRYGECLLPLCRDCIPIHRKEHSNLKEPIQLVTVDEQTYGLHHSISLQSSRLDDIHRELEGNVDAGIYEIVPGDKAIARDYPSESPRRKAPENNHYVESAATSGLGGINRQADSSRILATVVGTGRLAGHPEPTGTATPNDSTGPAR
ncbi:unnamed protein product [Sphagnum balticum]